MKFYVIKSDESYGVGIDIEEGVAGFIAVDDAKDAALYQHLSVASRALLSYSKVFINHSFVIEEIEL